MSSETTAGSQPAIPLGPMNNNHASTESNAPSEPGPAAVAPSTSSSSSAPVTNANQVAETPTWWTSLLKAGRCFNSLLTLFVTLATLVLAFVLFKPQTLSTKLAIWTSQKDYLEYCQNHVKQTGGKQDQSCQEALRRVLPPPPVSRLLRRLNVTSEVLNRYVRKHHPSVTVIDSDVSGVGIQPLLAAELIFWLLSFFVTWHVVLKACRTCRQGTRMNTPVGVGQKTKAEKNVQVLSGPYEAWVPDFVVRSFSSSIRKIRITQETRLLWRPSTVDLNGTQPESTLRRRHKKSYVSTPKAKGVPIEISDNGDSSVPYDESDSELWVPVDRPQNTWFNDRHFEKLMPAMAALIGTYASILEVASKHTFTFYIDKVNSRNYETPVCGRAHSITAPAYTLPLSDHSRDMRAKLAVSPLVMRIRRNIMDHGDVVYVSPQLRSSWQLTLNKSDNFNAVEITSSIVKRDYAGSSSFKSLVTKKMVPQMPTSCFTSPFSSITFAVHEDQNLVSIFVDTDDEHEHAWAVLTRELEGLFVKGPKETLRLYRYPKGELDGTKDVVPLSIWIYHHGEEPTTALLPPLKKGHKRSTQISSLFALPPPALGLDVDKESAPQLNGTQSSTTKTTQDLRKPFDTRKAIHPLAESMAKEASFANTLSPHELKQARKKRLQRYALAHGKTLGEVTSEQFEDDEEPVHHFTMEDPTDQIAEDKRNGDWLAKQWEDSLRLGLGTYQDNVPLATDIGGLAKGSSLRHRVRELIPLRKPVRGHGGAESEPHGMRRRYAFSAPNVPYK